MVDWWIAAPLAVEVHTVLLGVIGRLAVSISARFALEALDRGPELDLVPSTVRCLGRKQPETAGPSLAAETAAAAMKRR